MSTRPCVYIPNYNGGERLARALASLREQTRPIDVVVVDNGSGDGSPGRVREEFPEVGLVEMGRNAGFGPALNHAIRERPGDHEPQPSAGAAGEDQSFRDSMEGCNPTATQPLASGPVGAGSGACKVT
jgi:hypothetical protein